MEQERQGKGALIGTIIVIVLLIVGGYFLWKKSGMDIMGGQTASDEIGAIEADLSAGAAFEGFSDEELSDIEEELE